MIGPKHAPTTASARHVSILCLFAVVVWGVASCSEDTSTGAGGPLPGGSDAPISDSDSAEPDASDRGEDAPVTPEDDARTDSSPDATGDDDDAGESEPQVVRLLVIGDTGEGNDAQHRVAAGAQARCDRAGGCHGFLMLGDNIYDTGPDSADDPQFDTKVDEPYRVLKYGAPPASGQPDERERMPIYVTLGNHDLGGAGLNRTLIDHYLEYAQRHDWFHFPAAWWEKKLDFVHLMAIETNALAYLGSKYEEQGEMVEQALSSSDARWTIVFGHHPYRSDGRHGNAGEYEGVPGDLTPFGGEFRKWIDEFVCNRADFYLSGHDHNRQWMNTVPEIPNWQPFWQNKETRPCNSWFAVSGAGAKLRDMVDRDNDLAFGEASLGFLLMEFYPDRVVAEYCDADGNTEWTRTLTSHQTMSAPYEAPVEPEASRDQTASERAQRAAEACQKGSAKACYELGDMLHGGDGIGRDNDLSITLIELACEQGYGRACHDLGARYHHGVEVEQDLLEARSYFQRACDHNVASACHMLGTIARDGVGVPVDTELAERYFERACRLGFSRDCQTLTLPIEPELGRFEWGLPRGASDAVVQQARICDSGVMSGCVDLARAYTDGAGVPVDPRRAYELYEVACDWGALQACEVYRGLDR